MSRMNAGTGLPRQRSPTEHQKFSATMDLVLRIWPGSGGARRPSTEGVLICGCWDGLGSYNVGLSMYFAEMHA